MAGSTSNLDQLATADRSKEARINSLFDAGSSAHTFGRQASSSVALTWGYYGGAFTNGQGVTVQIANGTLSLTASQTNYVEVDGAGVVSFNTSGFTAGKQPLYTVVCNSTAVTSFIDHRSGAHGEFHRNRRIITLAYSANLTIDWALGYDVVRITLTGNLALTFQNGGDGQVMTLELTQGGAGGYTVTLPGDVRYSTDLASYSPAGTAGKMDRIGFMRTAVGSPQTYDLVAMVKGF